MFSKHSTFVELKVEAQAVLLKRCCLYSGVGDENGEGWCVVSLHTPQPVLTAHGVTMVTMG